MDCLFCGKIGIVTSCERCLKRLCAECMFAHPIDDDSLDDYQRYPHDLNCMPIKCDCGHVAYLSDAIFAPEDGDQCGIDELYKVYNRQDAINEWSNFAYPKESYWICGAKDCLRISCSEKECVKALLAHRHNHSLLGLFLVGKRNERLSVPKDLYRMIRRALINEDLNNTKGYYYSTEYSIFGWLPTDYADE